MAEPKRERLFQVRMFDAEMDMLNDLAKSEGVRASEWFRNIIRREHLLAFGAKPSAKRKPKK